MSSVRKEEQRQMRQRYSFPKAPCLSLKHRLQPKASSSLWPDRARGTGAHSAEGPGRLRRRQVQGHARDLLLQGELASARAEEATRVFRGTSSFLYKRDVPPHLLASSYDPTNGGGRDTSPASESTGEARVARGGVCARSPSHIAVLTPKKGDAIISFESWGKREPKPLTPGRWGQRL